MPAYLLSWNPKNFSTGGDGSDQGSLDYQKGEVVRWSCHSKQALEGDTVYLIKLGKGAKGIIAKGTVTKASYLAECWKDPTKERTYVDFRLEVIRHNCDEGLIPQVLLQKACPLQQWSPQSSGISIKPEYLETVNALWQEGASVHSLTIYFNWMSQYQHYPRSWLKEYTEMCELGQAIKQAQKVHDDELEKIWAKKANGIASVGQGFMYKKEFSNNIEYLRSVTLDVINEPSKANYDRLHKEWRVEGDFERTLWSVIRRVFALADPEHLTSIVGDEYLDAIFPLLNEQFEIDIYRSKHWFDDNVNLIEVTSHCLPVGTNSIRRNILLWLLYEYSQPNKNKEIDSGLDDAFNGVGEQMVSNYEGIQMNSSLNQIMYGPPGTGKTYRTVQMAVTAAEPNFEAEGQTRKEIRKSYKDRYDTLVLEGRIRFVTFHQSYGYEEFVEGLSAKTEGDQLSYFEKDGVFKTICEDAKVFRLADKISVKSEFEQRWQQFSETLAESDSGIQIQTLSKKTYFTVTDVTNNTIRFDKSKGDSIHTLSVRTLKAVYNNEKVIKGGLQPYYGALIKYLDQISVSPADISTERKNFVLIIDEINRGNISKIFGELITLIEPSKRLGQPESLEVILPYSGDIFSVPDNLYLIGTMNTADRSLALMDTALRRRFDFVEMMPDYAVLHDDDNAPYCVVTGGSLINLVELLQVLNKRITALYDREHSLGHAFLMPVVEAINAGNHSKAIKELAKCFQNKIIPLLAEYFFEDWQKIRLVLGDNQKEQKQLDQLIERSVVEFDSLFGDTSDLDLMDDNDHDYRLVGADSPLWLDPRTYVGMYDLSQIDG